MRTVNEKIRHIGELASELEHERKKRKKIVLCHGVFDLMHPGHILYFQGAKKHGDVLVVTVTPDNFVNKGPGRPVFNQRLRMESIASLECVDYVALNEWPTAVETIRRLKPHVYAKGQDYANAASDITGQIRNEMAAVKAVGGKTVFTNEQAFSSSSLINKFFDVYPPATSQYLKDFRNKHTASDIFKLFKEASKLKGLVIGEAILDQYCYCNPMAKSPKETIVASRFLSEENFPGGSLAIANHLAGICKSVTLVTAMGKEPHILKYFKKKLRSNVQFRPHFMNNAPTITKRRYVEPNFLTKMFEIQYLDDSLLSPSEESQIVNELRDMLPKYDFVVVADYGHGLFTQRLRDEVCSLAKFLCVNTQTNSANYGFNVATKYHKADFVSIDEPELKLALRTKVGDVASLAQRLRDEIKSRMLLVSLGHNGSVIVSNRNSTFKTPIFSGRVVDRIGAGDAVFAITSPFVFNGVSEDIIGFLGSCAGAMAVGTVCNRDPIDPVQLQKFITGLMK